MKLLPKDGGTLLSYAVEAQIGGKLAQLGQRLINGAAKKLADDFFQNFAAAVEPTPSHPNLPPVRHRGPLPRSAVTIYP